MNKCVSVVSLSWFACVLLLSSCVPMRSHGQGSGGRYGHRNDSYQSSRRQTVRCESRNGRSEYCPTAGRGEVRLDRQLSDAPCRKDDTWGTDRERGGIWVAQGCRAVFSVEG